MDGFPPNFTQQYIEVEDVITCDNFFHDRLRDVDSLGVENRASSLTKPVAVNTGLRNCAACD